MHKIRAILESIEQPNIADDSADVAEENVGNYAIDAYFAGYRDGAKKGQYDLACRLLRIMDVNGYGIMTSDESEKIQTKGEPNSA